MSFTSESMRAPDSPDPLLVLTFPLGCPAGVSRFTKSRTNSPPPPRSAPPSVFVGSADSSSTAQPSVSEPSWPLTFCLTSCVTWYEVLPLPSTHIQRLTVSHRLLLSGNFRKLLFVKINEFLAAPGLHCCSWVLSHCLEWGLLSSCMRGLLVAVSSPVVEPGLWGSRASAGWARGLSSCSAQGLGHRFSRCGART